MTPQERIQQVFMQMQGGALAQPQSPPMTPQAATGALTAPAPTPQTGFMNKLTDYATKNRNALVGGGLGMLTAGNNSQAFQQGLQGYQTGGAVDKRNAGQNATENYLRSKGMDEQTIEFLKANPSMMKELLNGGQSDPTTQMKEYQMALSQGYEGTLMDYMRDKEVENLPKGYERYQTEDGTQAIRPMPGSKEAFEMEENRNKALQRQLAAADAGNNVLSAIADIRKSDETSMTPVTGLIGSTAKYIPGTEASNVNSSLNTIKSNVSFDRLQAMRNNSPTGGALGNVSNIELSLLSASISALEQSQSKEQFFENLEQVEYHYYKAIHGEEAANQFRAKRQASGGATGDDEIDQLLEQYGTN